MTDPLARITVGLISDTHGTLPEAALDLFRGCDLIIHAGDIGAEEILFELQTAAPVVAVSGNMDQQYPAWPLEPVARIEIGGKRIVVIHDRGRLGSLPPDTDAVIFGHTHEPQVLEIDGVHYVNPGSASQSRTADGAGTVGMVVMALGRIRPRIVSIGS